MDDIGHVRKRIKSRRYGEVSQGTQSHRFAKGFYRFIMLVMGVCMAVLAVLVNQKLEIVEMPAALQNFKIENLSSWIPFEGWFSLKDEAVSATPGYSLLKDNQYSNGSNIAYNAYDAIILHVQQNKNGKTTMSVKQDNGVVATYGNLSDVSLKQDERILKGRPLGTYTSYVTIDFLKNNKKIDINAALQNSEN